MPTPPNTEGNYLFVNKNVIEMFALLVLATTASGQWFGVDSLISWMFGALFGRKAPPPAPVRARHNILNTSRERKRAGFVSPLACARGWWVVLVNKDSLR